MTIELSLAAKEQLIEIGLDPSLGARPLRRAVQHEIEDRCRRRSCTASSTRATTCRSTSSTAEFTFATGRQPGREEVLVGDAPEIEARHSTAHTLEGGSRTRTGRPSASSGQAGLGWSQICDRLVRKGRLLRRVESPGREIVAFAEVGARQSTRRRG